MVSIGISRLAFERLGAHNTGEKDVFQHPRCAHLVANLIDAGNDEPVKVIFRDEDGPTRLYRKTQQNKQYSQCLNITLYFFLKNAQ